MRKWFSVFVVSTLGAYIYKSVIKPILRYKNVEDYLINNETATFEVKPITSSTIKPKLDRRFKNISLQKFMGLIAFSILLGWFFQHNSYWLSSNILKSDIQFSGTYFPIQKVPVWTELTAAERGLTYEQMPAHKMQNIPLYNSVTFQKGINWTSGNASARNAYVTYSVPYLGSYELNGKENDGSHPGIDIKSPRGTPVHVYANGIVTKVANQPTGFGNHIVVAHPNVPDPNRTGKTTTLYSSYSHLSKVLVKEGQIVNKADIIGKVGDTGMTTANHLHFQLDTADAPFFPYWPFSWAEIKNAGISSYFNAVNRAFGISNAKKYTYNPATYYAKYKNYKGGSETKIDQNAAPKETITKESPEESVVENTVVETEKEKIEEVIEEELASTTKYSNPYAEVLFETDAVFLKGKENIVRVSTNDLTQFNTPVSLNSTLKSLADITPSALTKSNFKNGLAEVRVKTNSSNSFRLLAQGDFGEIESNLIKPLVFLDIKKGSKYEAAISFLKDKKVIEGYEDGTYRPKENLTRAQAMKLIIESNEMRLMPAENNFVDVDESKWYGTYISTALARNIVKGYEDGTFKPKQSITRAEFLKMALETSDLQLSAYNGSNYSDVSNIAWYEDYMKVAKKESMFEVDSSGNVWPNQKITREVAAYVLWKIHKAEQK